MPRGPRPASLYQGTRTFMNRIFSQGDFDGACFIYSAANAAQVLSPQKATQKRWNEALKWIPFSDDFITDNGTWRYDEDIDLYIFSLKRMFREFAPNSTFEITHYPNINSAENIRNLINQHSVVVLNINLEHWVTCIDTDVENILIACSYQLSTLREKYSENTSGEFKRKYNLKMPIAGKNWIHNPSVFVITLV